MSGKQPPVEQSSPELSDEGEQPSSGNAESRASGSNCCNRTKAITKNCRRAFGKRLSLMGAVVRCNANGFAVMFDEPIDEKLFNQGDRGLKCAEGSLDSEDLKN